MGGAVRGSNPRRFTIFLKPKNNGGKMHAIGLSKGRAYKGINSALVVKAVAPVSKYAAKTVWQFRVYNKALDCIMYRADKSLTIVFDGKSVYKGRFLDFSMSKFRTMRDFAISKI
jgi:hypothetical protein